MIFMNFSAPRGFLEMYTVRAARPLAALTLSVVASVAAAAPAKRDDQILIQGLAAGSQAVETVGTDSVRCEYSFTIAAAVTTSWRAGNSIRRACRSNTPEAATTT